MAHSKIGFIGGGNMATSLIAGLIADGCPADSLFVADPNEARCQLLHDRFGIHILPDNQALVAATDVVVLAVKPQRMHEVCSAIAATVAQHRPLLISIAAGLRMAALRDWLGDEAAIVRAMPNTPAMVQSGATALFANDLVMESQRQLAETILRAAGLTRWLSDEGQMDAVTAVSGSGPAYFFLLMEMLEDSAIQLGLNADDARLLVLQTAFGAAKMALESHHEAAQLRAQVTSPGGTTERAIGLLEQGGIRPLFHSAVSGAQQRARELADELGAQ